jgi:ArsR family transcriptional regulator, arsenate/arsenite/antimonite-responsive transcriptional repressor
MSNSDEASAPSETARLADMFKALSNPNRLRIFLRLLECCGPGVKCRPDDQKACVGDLGRDLTVGAPTVSHHLNELRRAGLISCERDGQKVVCWIEPQVLRGLAGFFGAGSSMPEEGADDGG